jgi:uncharacterized protein YqgC (DUF456 family)
MPLLILACVIIISEILIVLGLPGLWIMVATAVTDNLTVPGEPSGWFTLVAVGVLARVAELLEFTLAGKYARKYGGSRRAGWGAIIGGIVGAMVGVPVPIVGPVIGAFVGSFIGALVAELSRGSTAGDATRVAKGALIGRAVSTALKVGIGFTIGIWIFISAAK